LHAAHARKGEAQDMNEEISELVARLDRLVPREGGSILIKEDHDWRLMVGNPDGYMRFGIEILKAVIAAGPPGVEGKRLQPDFEHVCHEWGEEFTLDLVDNPSFLSPGPSERDAPGCGGLALGLALLGVLWKLASVLFR
jgi:hypothetical protein